MRLLLDGDVRQHLCEILSDVWSFIGLEPGKRPQGARRPEPVVRVSTGRAGERGALSLSTWCAATTASALAETMLRLDGRETGCDDVEDVMAEIAEIVGGPRDVNGNGR